MACPQAPKKKIRLGLPATQWITIYNAHRPMKQRYHYNVANTRVDQHVEKGNDDGLYISSVACCHELWALIMDAGTGFSAQVSYAALQCDALHADTGSAASTVTSPAGRCNHTSVHFTYHHAASQWIWLAVIKLGHADQASPGQQAALLQLQLHQLGMRDCNAVQVYELSSMHFLRKVLIMERWEYGF